MEIAEAELERMARRARRVAWAFRLIFYPGAVIVAVLILAGRSHGDGPVFMTGTTSQGGAVELRLEDGEPARLLIDIRSRCPDRDWWFKWSHGPAELREGRLTIRESAGRRYAYHDQTSRRTVTLDARLDDGTISGTATSVEHFDGPDWGAYACLSDVVSFSAWPD